MLGARKAYAAVNVVTDRPLNYTDGLGCDYSSYSNC